MGAWGHCLYACRACADLTSRPHGSLAGCGLSLAWWNRLTTTLGDTRDHPRGTSCTRGLTDEEEEFIQNRTRARREEEEEGGE